MWWIDRGYIIYILPFFILTLIAQINVNSTFNRYAKQMTRRGITAAAAARKLLDLNGLRDISIVQIAGNLTDNYNPKTNVVSLSQSTHDSASVAAIGVAAHEVGHAIQHAKGYVPIKVRNAFVPVVNFASHLAVPLFLIGLVLNFDVLADLGIWFFAAAVAFQLITLPVEFNASRRAIASLEGELFLEADEVKGARKVLSAAALTYVASAAMAIAQLLRLIALRGNRR